MPIPYNPDIYNPSESQNTTVKALKELASLLEIRTSRKSKADLIRALHRKGYFAPQMSEDDALCASRFSNLSKEEVVYAAVTLDLVNPSSTKIDACRALHNVGIKNEDILNMIMTPLNKPQTLAPLESQKWEEWQCERPTNVVSNYSCGMPGMKNSNGELNKPAEGWENKKFSSESACNKECVKKGSSYINKTKTDLENRYKPSPEQPQNVNPNGPPELPQVKTVTDFPQGKTVTDLLPKAPEPYKPKQKQVKTTTENPKPEPSAPKVPAQEGKKCRRSKVGKNFLMRDKKGRFCKKRSKRRSRK